MMNEHHVYHSSKMFIIVGQTDTIGLLLYRTRQSCRITFFEVTN